jgi:hypothetical protein
MLELRPNCECCNRDLPPSSIDVRICTFECTFCVACAEGVLQNTCPNCGGGLVRRPVRPAKKLDAYPASAIRVYEPLAGERKEKHAAYVECYRGVDPAKR